MSRITITSEPHASPEDLTFVENQIDELNMRLTGDRDYHLVALFLRDDGGHIKGGLIGHAWGSWLNITFLWVDESLRGQGYGGQLLRLAEDEGRAYGCKNVHLGTFSFQARPFYQHFGYQVIAELPDYPPGHSQYFLTKAL